MSRWMYKHILTDKMRIYKKNLEAMNMVEIIGENPLYWCSHLQRKESERLKLKEV